MSSNSVYMFGDVDIHDLEEYKKYMEKVKPMIESYRENTLFVVEKQRLRKLSFRHPQE